MSGDISVSAMIFGAGLHVVRALQERVSEAIRGWRNRLLRRHDAMTCQRSTAQESWWPSAAGDQLLTIQRLTAQKKGLRGNEWRMCAHKINPYPEVMKEKKMLSRDT